MAVVAKAVAGLVIAWTLTARPAVAAGPARPRPNVVVIVTDDLGYNDLGVQGSPDVRTPHLDALAKGGVTFSNAYVTAPICGASRAGLISGRYQQRHSYEGNPRPTEGLALTESTLADAFHSAGYATGAVGKWSIGQGPHYRPLRRGFDEYFGFLGMMHPYVPGEVDPALRMVGEPLRPGFGAAGDTPRGAASRPDRGAFGQGATTRPGRGAGGFGGGGGGGGGQTAIGAAAGKFVRGNDEVDERGYATEAFAREAVAFIDRHQKEPFFLYLAFNASHSPLQPPKAYVDRYPNLIGKRQLYAATTTAMDDAVGRVVEELRQAGLSDDVPQRGVATPLLFDLQSDVAETTDVAAEHPEVVARLTAKWQSWNADNRPLSAAGGAAAAAPEDRPATRPTAAAF